MRRALALVLGRSGRKAVSGQASTVHTLAAPTRGLVLNENIAASTPQSARVLDNWLPVEEGVRLRRGSSRHGTVGGTPVSTMSYKGTASETFFVATATDIYNMGAPGSTDTAPTASWTGQTAGYYVSAPMETAGGNFMVAVNGAETALVWNGSAFYPLVDEAISTLAYDALTAAFAVGETLTGGTSAATATIYGVQPADGTTGTLYLGTITGTFQDNETITDSATGSATANGTATLAQSAAITGIATDQFSAAWTFKERLFFIEKDSLKAWYLPVQAIGGAAGDINLAGVMQRGGKLLFGATWSMDSGDGMDDRCVFVTDQGEVAIYAGTDPGDATAWAIVGRYDMAKPLGPKCFIRAGGDLIIGTQEGAIPLSQVVSKDPAALSASAVTRPIEPMWRDLVAARTTHNWEMAKSYMSDFAVVTNPTETAGLQAQVLVVNIKTGAWCRWTGIDALCIAEFAGDVYIANSSNRVLKLDDGATDDGSAYYCRLATHFDHLNSYATYKQIHMLRATLISNMGINAVISISKDYEHSFPPSPSPSMVETNSLWGTAVFGTDVWYSADPSTVETEWKSVDRNARVVSAQIEIGIDAGAAPDVTLASIDILFTPGGAVV